VKNMVRAPMPQPAVEDFRWRPVTADRWDDLAALFGARGACAGCWCMYWRLPAGAWEAGKGESNRRALQTLVAADDRPGILGYLGGEPVAWCAVAPRDVYPRLARSRVLKPVDQTPVWSISCLFVRKDRRRQGLSVRMLEAAVGFAGERGATVVEGYPYEPTAERAPDAFVWTGLASAYRTAGFTEVARRSPTRPIMRRTCR
jgi:GNAT superfamily N-acetyltransferase